MAGNETTGILYRSSTTTNVNGAEEEQLTWLPLDHNFATLAIQSGRGSSGDPTGSVVPAISVTTIFERESTGVDKGYAYTRYGNPTRSALETTLAALEKGKFAFTYSSGHGAILNIVSLFKHGDNVICPDSMYEGTSEILKQVANTAGIETTFVDMTDLSLLEQAVQPNTKLVWIETPSNPTLKVYDIQAAVKIVRKCSKEIIVAVDNTFMTPFFQKPLSLGADLSVHSLSKYAGGHSDILMGAVITNREDLRDKLKYLQKALGAVPSPIDCYLMARSIKTLPFRMPVHMSNGLTVAKFLQGHPKVETVMHPGLPSHPTHRIALKQSSGHSGMVSMVIKNGAGCPLKFAQNLRVFTFADSLGGVESLVKIPVAFSNYLQQAPASQAVTTEYDKKRDHEITRNFVRLSVGLENIEDLIEDLNQALNSC